MEGDKCDQVCEIGYFGLNCKSPCSITNCKDSTSCDHVTGGCQIGCVEGWVGTTCSGKRLCDPSRGQCHGCVDGRSGLFCETEVVENNPLTETTSLVIAVVILSLFIILMVVVFLACVLKRKCQSSHSTNAGQDYETTLSAKDKNLAFNKTVRVSKRYNNDYFAPSKVVDGNWSISLLQCALTASGQKEAWLTIDLGERKNVASITMIHGTLGFGSSSISSSVSGLKLMLMETGQSILANRGEEFVKYSFDETVPGRCDLGFYGVNCTQCPRNCFNNSCHFKTGECVNCIAGYIGASCETVCENGYFGLNCELSCNIPNCRNSTSCDVITGECLEGCIEGLAGKTCT
ncbi:multiple epidermal growth factor-like domains protein 10, partial [Saccostrea cucullata]|uniref:multiple epidermal growth factor-like domains protein 10 n=1 Tax=Saccostrea cuccullata TaxID=36930 RepID=UPI002ED1088F